jgi:hypothetical protein
VSDCVQFYCNSRVKSVVGCVYLSLRNGPLPNSRGTMRDMTCDEEHM